MPADYCPILCQYLLAYSLLLGNQTRSMKKIILAALLITGIDFTATAQKGLSMKNAPLSLKLDNTEDNSRALFKQRSVALEAALKANNVAEAQKLIPEVQQLIMKRGDDFLGKDEAKVKQFHDLGYEMKALMLAVEANKEKILTLNTKVRVLY